MNDIDMQNALRAFDTSNVRELETAWQKVKPLGIAVIPGFLDFYPKVKKAQGRTAFLYYATSFARTSEAAVRLGILALGDKASLARYRACGLLAYSLRVDAIPHLKPLLQHRDAKTAADAAAAIDAITRKNHHYFVDRTHSGRSFWQVNPEDGPT